MKIKCPKFFLCAVIVIAVMLSGIFVKIASLPSTVSLTNNKDLISLSKDKLKSNLIYTVDSIETFNNSLDNQKNLKVKLFGLIPIKNVSLNLGPEIKVIPGGETLGIKLLTDGIIVVGFSDIEEVDGERENPALKADIEIGDVIIEANGVKLNEINTLSDIIANSGGKNIILKIKRKNDLLDIKVIPIKQKESSEYKIGLWVRNSTSGIGTLTFYEEKSGVFGALGHPINDVDTGKILTLKEGTTHNAKIMSVEKGEKGDPGELKAIFDENKKIGTLNKNTFSGVYGRISDINSICENKKPMFIARQSEVKEGPAKILACVNGGKVKEYDINIEKLTTQSKPSSKSMIIKVVDKELLETTGGIVQGMSGSPIIQNNKIIGAVTHVFVNRPNMGYGIYIEWMLKEAAIDK